MIPEEQVWLLKAVPPVNITDTGVPLVMMTEQRASPRPRHSQACEAPKRTPLACAALCESDGEPECDRGSARPGRTHRWALPAFALVAGKGGPLVHLTRTAKSQGLIVDMLAVR